MNKQNKTGNAFVPQDPHDAGYRNSLKKRTVMRFPLFGIALCVAVLHPALVVAAEVRGASIVAQQITRAGSQPSAAGPAANFTGPVRVDMIWPADDGISASGALVTFEPGARSARHMHPAGQRLVVVTGMGLT